MKRSKTFFHDNATITISPHLNFIEGAKLIPIEVYYISAMVTLTVLPRLFTRHRFVPSDENPS
jgi:hypothetical protein